MSTRELYFKSLLQTDLPCGQISFMRKKDKIISFDRITVSFHEKDRESAVNKMIETESTDNFLCWTNSIEGQSIIEGIRFKWNIV